jgi:hypothetical protein
MGGRSTGGCVGVSRFCRPQRYSEAATRTTVINDPITIPVMATPERLDPEEPKKIEIEARYLLLSSRLPFIST